jgi:thiamine-monophosphate kinase
MHSLSRTRGRRERFTLAEDALVEKIDGARRLRRAKGGVRVGVGDDAAVFQPRAGYETILTCDWFLEGSHFLRNKHPADAVGWKCLARALSDIAAMGGEPRCFVLSLALPVSHTGSWLDGFLAGLRRAEERFQCFLAGGDTTRSNRILIQVTVVGEARCNSAMLRRGAQPGDLLFVSGQLGEAELGLRQLRRTGKTSRRDPQLRKHLYPEPRLELGAWLARNRLATAMMDVSDGLSTDLARLCAASRVGAKVQSKQLPLPTRGQRSKLSKRTLLEVAVHGGDDYELLFTVSRANVRRVPPRFKGLRLTRIGEISRERWIRIEIPERGDVVLAPRGWDPFRPH